ncbi:MAG TPA: ATP-binding protein [Bacteroidales bacterium]|nr:ATP-binding protein [Bacteroidales bacterium]
MNKEEYREVNEKELIYPERKETENHPLSNRLSGKTGQFPQCVWIIDHSGVFRLAAGISIIDGQRMEKFMGKSLQEIRDTGYNFCVPENIFTRAQRGEAIEYETNHNNRTFAVKLIPVNQTNANLEGILGQARDITEQRDYEQELLRQNETILQQNNELQEVNDMLAQKNSALSFFNQRIIESENKFRMLFDNLNDVVTIHDLQGNFLEVNPETCKRFKYTKDQLLNMNVADVNPDFSPANSTMQKILEEKEFIFETENFDSEGNCIPTEVNSRLIAFRNQPAMISVARDITERKKIRENLILAKKKAEEADRLKSAFLANMSHEIRTPLNAIVGFSDLMTSRTIPLEQQDTFLNHIRNSGYQLLNIINDIIDIARIEAGQLQINYEEVPTENMLQELYSHYQGVLRKKNSIKLKLEIPSDQKIDSILSDGTRIRQIFNNLLGNAIKFTDEGFITFGYRIMDKNMHDQKITSTTKDIRFFVKDTGIGIKQEDLEKVFDRFKQVEDGYTRNHTGTGLGLTISRNLSRILGGDMWLESEYGKGTTFYFTLPANIYESKDKHNQSITVNEMNPNLYDWKNKTILIAEDEETNFLYLEELLSESEPDIIRACDGAEAVEIALNNPGIDIVLMDIKMPVLSGIEAAKKIRTIKKHLPIIAQTAYAMYDDRKKYLESGLFDEYVSKPIKKEKLFPVMQKFLQGK